MTIKMIEILFLNCPDTEDLDEESQRLHAQTKSNLDKINSKEKKGGKPGVMALVTNNTLSTM